MAEGRIEGAADREIVTSRLIRAQRELVFKAWTDTSQLEQWWGPSGFTTTTHQFDMRPGGVWSHTMHGPDGRDYPNRVRFHEIVASERLVYAHETDDEASPGFKTTVTFEFVERGTLLTMRGVFPSKEARDYVIREYDAENGARQTIARLDEFVRGRQ
jgi:uncharacterized protein YndB with AHSA1/START domain